jgi:hypothetical protein
MKTIKLLIVSAVVLISYIGWSQSCDSLTSVCKNYLSQASKVDPKIFFVSDGQTYRALLSDEQTAEFSTTFYGGNYYRVAASAGTKDNYMIFELFDQEHNLLFSNADYGNATYWDFKVESTIDVTIEARLDGNKKQSGCSVMLIGFKQLKK